MADRPSPPFDMHCPWCDWYIVVNARGSSGNDPGSGVEAAQMMEAHVGRHDRTWAEYLVAETKEEA
jgi:hypothetical protein